MDSNDEVFRDRSAPPDQQAIRNWLITQVARELHVDPSEIEISKPFAHYGLDSAISLMVTSDLEEFLGRSLDSTLLWNYPTIEKLAQYLSADKTPSTNQTEFRAPARFEPIAIIGMGCRFPGASGPKAFWKLLCEGNDAIREIPPDRWDANDFYSPESPLKGKMNTKWGGFLDQIDGFDPSFFGITPRETLRLDPQHRLLLEVAWETLEDAGQLPAKLAGSRTGVFIGLSTSDYGTKQVKDPANIDVYVVTGNALSVAANRISYFFDFRGPSMAIDTACSSSLVAIELACRSLWNGESELALAGGANLILSPSITINLSQGLATSPDGRCKPFDADANGIVRSEGVGLVALKPLSKALVDGDSVYSLILGGAINQDGRTNGITAPSQWAQQAVLLNAYNAAGVLPSQVQYVDAHGTGTLLGDPIEVRALGVVLAKGREAGRFCKIGSVKSNLGHLEAAAGIAGLMKVALALKHRQIPPSIHFKKANPHIPFETLPVRVQESLGEWPDNSVPKIAGVSAFGFGGTNAHVVLKEAYEPAASSLGEREGIKDSLLVMSAHNERTLEALVHEYREFLRAADDSRSFMRDVCYTASVRRSHHKFRLAVMGTNRDEFVAALEGFMKEGYDRRVVTGTASGPVLQKIAFVYSGQGAAIEAEVDELEGERSFRIKFEECAAAISEQLKKDVSAELKKPAGKNENTLMVQLRLFAWQVALTELWRSWGVTPAGVVGHSAGEVAAAHAAGVLSLADAVRVISSRGDLMQRALKDASDPGAMAVVKTSLELAEQAVDETNGEVSIAAHNSPHTVVLSGATRAVKQLVEQFGKAGMKAHLLPLPGAGHSRQAEPLREQLAQLLIGIQPKDSRVPIYSTVKGRAQRGAEFDALYWGENLRQTVLFAEAIGEMVNDGYEAFVELNGHPVLTAALTQCLRVVGKQAVVVGSVRQQQPARTAMLSSLASLYVQGYELDWNNLYKQRGRCVSLPAYPWQRESFWADDSNTPIDRSVKSHTVALNGYALCGRHLQSAVQEGTHYWEIDIDLDSFPYLRDHRVQGAVILPAAFYLEMVNSAAAQVFGDGPHALESISFAKALPLPANESRKVQLVLTQNSSNAATFQILSTQAAKPAPDQPRVWNVHVTGTIVRSEAAATPAPRETPDQIRTRCTEEISGPAHYRLMKEQVGYDCGPSFRGLTQISRGNGEAIAGVLSTFDSDCYSIHPVLLDCCFQTLGATFAVDNPNLPRGDSYLIVGLKRFRLWSSTANSKLVVHAQLRSDLNQDVEIVEGDVVLLDDTGQPLLEVEALRLQRLPSQLPQKVSSFYEIFWEKTETAQQIPPATESGASWLVFADRSDVSASIVDRLRSDRNTCVCVTAGPAYRKLSDDAYEINPERPDDFSQLLREVFQESELKCSGVLYLWGIEYAAASQASFDVLSQAYQMGCVGLLHAVQSLAVLGWQNVPRLWIVTAGTSSFSLEDTLPSIAQSWAWGFARTIAFEHPAFHCTTLDLSLLIAGKEIENVVAILEENRPEDHLTIRGESLYIARLRHSSLTSQPDCSKLDHGIFQADGSYLITGGLGGLGLTVAQWAVTRGARHLTLVGRTPPSEFARAKLLAMEKLGATIVVAQADVASKEQLEKVIEEITASPRPLRGVIHAAGTLDDALLLKLSLSSFMSVAESKIKGALNLHQLTREQPLAFFVMFSSVASLLGSPGQANYAAANSFLDGFAHYRRALKLPALSINWGPWAEVGGAAALNSGPRLATRGVESLSVDQALRALEQLIHESAVQVGVVPLNIRQWFQFFPKATTSSLFSDLVKGMSHPGSESRDPADAPFRKVLLATQISQRKAALRTHLREEIAQVIGLTSAKVDPQAPLGNLGIDSLMTLELRNRLESSLGLVLSPTVVWSYPTINALVPYLAGQMDIALDSEPQKKSDEAVRPKEVTIDLDQLSKENLAELLAQEISMAEEGKL